MAMRPYAIFPHLTPPQQPGNRLLSNWNTLLGGVPRPYAVYPWLSFDGVGIGGVAEAVSEEVVGQDRDHHQHSWEEDPGRQRH